MKVVKNNDSNTPLTLAEMEACRQFEQSQRDGQALFHPRVGAGQPAPNVIALFEEVGRFAVTILPGRHAVRHGKWWRLEDNGIQTPVDNPLELAWQAAKGVRGQLKSELGIGAYVIPVAWFPDMEDEDEDIQDEADGRSVRLCFGQVDLVQRLAGFPREDERQSHLSAGYIRREVAALSRSSDAASPEPAEVSSPVKGRVGTLVIERVETVNIHITVVQGGEDDDPPLVTVQGQ